jgi:NAD-dependent deacetylase
MKVVILTGAGISAESGLPTFRGADGLWEGHRVQDVATPEAFERDPETVQRFYNMRRAHLTDGTVHPNPAHLALAELERKLAGDLVIVTQNIDDLHERAGSRNLLHLHGELLKCRCVICDTIARIQGDLSTSDECAECGSIGTLRPDIVWFGEMPYHLDEISARLGASDLFVSIGTSGNVYPAAGFVALANRAGAHTVELNLEPGSTSSAFRESRLGRATEIVPEWVAEILGSIG